VETELLEDVGLLAEALDQTVRERSGDAALALLRLLRDSAVALREGRLAGGRDAFAAKLVALRVEELGFLARTFTLSFHLFNAAEEQHRILDAIEAAKKVKARPDAGFDELKMTLSDMEKAAGIIGQAMLRPCEPGDVTATTKIPPCRAEHTRGDGVGGSYAAPPTPR